MKITAITRYKHGELHRILTSLGWTQSQLAERCGISKQKMGSVINLRLRPSAALASKIQFALGEAGHYLDILAEWPESFKGLRRGYKVERTEDVEMVRLADHPEVVQLADESSEGVWEEMQNAVGDAVDLLPAQERRVIRDVFFNGMTEKDAAIPHGVSRSRIHQIEGSALRKLRKIAGGSFAEMESRL